MNATRNSRMMATLLAGSVILVLVAGAGRAGNDRIDFIFGCSCIDEPRGIHAVDDFTLVIANSGLDEILFYGADGRPVDFIPETIGGSGAGDGQMNQPKDVATEADGDIVVADTGNDRVQVFSPAGVFKLKFGTTGTGDGQFMGPCGVAVGSNGLIYVTDTLNDRVQAFNAAGVFQFSFGSSGTLDGEFDDPTGIATAPNGEVVVADRSNGRVQVFDDQGNFVRAFGSPGTGDGQFNSPWGVEVTTTGEIIVTDGLNDRIQIFSATGVFLHQIGTRGSQACQFKTVYGVTYVPGSGRMVVVDGVDDNPTFSKIHSIAPVQPDLWIGKKRFNQKGDDLYNPGGNRQKLRIHLRNRRSARIYYTAQNDGVIPDSLAIRVPTSNHKVKFRTLQLLPARLKITKANTNFGEFFTQEFQRGQRAVFRTTVRPKRGAFRGSISDKISALSRFDRTIFDSSKTKITR